MDEPIRVNGMRRMILAIESEAAGAATETGGLPFIEWLRELDEAASTAHDYIWSKNGVTQEQASEAIWKIHNDLRGVIVARLRGADREDGEGVVGEGREP